MNLKALIEKKNSLLDQLDGILKQAETETRAMNEEETTRFASIEAEIRSLETTISAAERAAAFNRTSSGQTTANEEQRALEDKTNFMNFVRGEQRALTTSQDSGGALIPISIANKIVEQVKEVCPIYSMVTVYNVNGDLIVPVYDESSSSIGAAYSDDMAELTESTGKFTTIKLENHIIGSLAKLSKSLMNRTDFDLFSFIVSKVAYAIAVFLEKELINGTADKMTGVLSAAQVVTAASSSAITTDELIDLQDMIPDRYQNNACWIMHKSTRKSIRKLKDTEGNYLLNRDLTAPFGYTLLGKPIYISDNMPETMPDSKVIAYGDMTGLTLKFAQQIELQVLMEKYATQHAIGVVGYVEADSKITEEQKLAVLQMKAS